MPSPEEMKNQELNTLNSYMQRKDSAGLLAHLEQVYASGKGADEDPRVDAYETFLRTALVDPSPETGQFLKDLVTANGERVAKLTMEAGIKSDDVRAHVLSAETEGLELLNEPKEIDSATRMFTTNKTSIGRELMISQAINISMTNVSWDVQNDMPKGRKNDLVNTFSDTFDRTVDADPRFDQETKNRYKELSKQVDKRLTIQSSKNDLYEITEDTIDADVADDGFVFSETSEYLQHLKNLSDDQLEQFTEELKQDKAHVQAYDKVVNSWSKTSAALAEEIKQNLSPEELQKEDCQKLLNELTARNVMPNYLTKSLKEVQRLSETLPESPLREKIRNEAVSAQSGINKVLSDGAAEVFKKNKTFAYSNVKIIDMDLRRVEKEQNYREIKADPDARKRINELNGKIKDCNAVQDEISRFKQQAGRAIRFTQTTVKNLEQDKAGRRDISDRNKHSEYYALTESGSNLSNMDLDKMTPKQILDKMKEAKAAADQYVATHAGITNFTKGWSSEARKRIEHARANSELLDKQIKALEPTANALTAKLGEGKTLEAKNTELEAEKTAYRAAAAEKKQEVLQDKDIKIGNRINRYQKEYAEHAKNREKGENGTILESACYAADNSLQKLQKVCNRKEPFTEEQKEQIYKHIGRVIAYDTRPFSENRDMTNREYKKFIGDFGQQPEFKEALKRTMGELTPKNLKKFCADPNMSKQFSNHFANVKKEIVDTKVDEKGNIQIQKNNQKNIENNNQKSEKPKEFVQSM